MIGSSFSFFLFLGGRGRFIIFTIENGTMWLSITSVQHALERFPHESLDIFLWMTAYSATISVLI